MFDATYWIWHSYQFTLQLFMSLFDDLGKHYCWWRRICIDSSMLCMNSIALCSVPREGHQWCDMWPMGKQTLTPWCTINVCLLSYSVALLLCRGTKQYNIYAFFRVHNAAFLAQGTSTPSTTRQAVIMSANITGCYHFRIHATSHYLCNALALSYAYVHSEQVQRKAKVSI